MEVAFYSTATGEKERVSDAYLFKQYKELTEEVQRLRGQTQEEPNVR
ncbi:hypothetical protein PZC41_14730 [Staphylococcus aureus]|nr:hypothetical protein [Staphylococcus aureus]MDE8535558.1 hypothetical protein [Staphylococcus aureus]